MNIDEMKAALKDRGIAFNDKTFKPNAEEIAVMEQLISRAQKVELKPVRTAP
jgi:hypothetical protein